MLDKEQKILEKAKEKGLINQKKIDKIIKLISKNKYKENKVHEEFGILLGEIINRGLLTTSIVQELESEIIQDISIRDTQTGTYTPFDGTKATSDSNIMESAEPKFKSKEKILFGKYEIIELLGSGGMAEVFKAYDTTLNRYVALKFLKKENPQRIKRFLREARLQAQVEHKNICKVYEVNEIEGKPFIAMQYINGKPLDEAARQMSLKEKVKIMQQVSEALYEAHNLGLIHRDIKPKNILVEKSPENELKPYLLDFGLAYEQSDVKLTDDGTILGTPVYMAPELLRVNNQTIDHKADIYSLGATFYEVLTNKSIIEGKTQGEILMNIMLAEIIPPRKINPLIPEDLEIIVMKCLEKQPSLRYNDARELAEDLKRFLEGEPIKARPHSWNYKIIKKVKKYKIPINLFLFAVIAFLIVLLLWHRSLQISQKQLQISMDFNQSIRYIEELLRHAYTSPLHDIRAEQKEVLIEIEKIKNQMLSIGEPANGPGNYAIGKAYLLLKDYENSKKYLELSKKSKYETPELFYALGQLYGTIYSNKVEDAEKIQDQQIKKAVIKELEKQFKIPAINYLSKSKNIKIESPEYIEGQIAFYEEKYDQAIEKLKLAYNKISWLYEAKRLEADIFVILGQNQQNKANYEQALKYYKQAESAYKEAIEIGRSDNTNYEGMCNLWNIRFRMEALDKGGMVEPNFSNAIKECDKALVAYPESTHAYKLKAILYNNLAEYEQFHGINPLPNIENALKNINTAIQIKPKDNALYNTLTFIYIKKANIEYEKGIDPTNTLNLAIQAAQKSFGLYPNDYITHNNVGIIYLLAAAHDLDSEKDPSGNINKSIEHFENAIKLENNFAYAYNNMGRSYWLLSKYLIKKNQDPSNSILKSIELYDTALKIQPNFLMALNNKGVSFFQYAEYQIKQGISPDASLDNAFLAFQQAQKINPNSPDILRKIAHTYLLKSEYYSIHGKNPIPLAQESIKLLTKAITLDANSANNYITLAESYKIIASYYLLNGENPLDAIENAKINYSKAIKLQPDNNITYANLIELLCLEIKYHLDNQSYPYNIIQYTIDIIEKTQNIDSSNFYTNLYSMIFYNLIADYEIENNLDPKHNIQKSEYILQKIKPTNPYDYNLLINEANLALLKIHWNLKMHLPYMNLIKNITSTLDKILSTNNNDINAHFLLCELNRHLAEYKVINNEMINNEIINAVSECDKVISLNQKHSYAIANKAILLLLKSRHELSNSKTEEAINQALTLFNKAIEINKNLPYKYKKHFELFKNDNYKNRALCN